MTSLREVISQSVSHHLARNFFLELLILARVGIFQKVVWLVLCLKSLLEVGTSECQHLNQETSFWIFPAFFCSCYCFQVFMKKKKCLISLHYPRKVIWKHCKIAKSCPEHITLMLSCQVVELFLLKDVTTITIWVFRFCHNLSFF